MELHNATLLPRSLPEMEKFQISRYEEEEAVIAPARAPYHEAVGLANKEAKPKIAAIKRDFREEARETNQAIKAIMQPVHQAYKEHLRPYEEAMDAKARSGEAYCPVEAREHEKAAVAAREELKDAVRAVRPQLKPLQEKLKAFRQKRDAAIRAVREECAVKHNVEELRKAYVEAQMRAWGGDGNQRSKEDDLHRRLGWDSYPIDWLMRQGASQDAGSGRTEGVCV